jgi:hypothetical protein
LIVSVAARARRPKSFLSCRISRDSFNNEMCRWSPSQFSDIEISVPV